MKPFSQIRGMFPVAVVGFALGVAIAVLRGWGSPVVSAVVVNKSEQPLQSVTVKYTTCGGKGSIVGGVLLPGESRTFRYSVCGEGAYIIEAQFSDERTVRTRERYVESGHFSTETISKNSIHTDQRTYAF